jgi:hypothetical protein
LVRFESDAEQSALDHFPSRSESPGIARSTVSLTRFRGDCRCAHLVDVGFSLTDPEADSGGQPIAA